MDQILNRIATRRDLAQCLIEALVMPMSDPEIQEAAEERHYMVHNKKPGVKLRSMEHPATVAHQYLRTMSQVNRFWHRAIKAWRLMHTPEIVKIERCMTTRRSKRDFAKKRNISNLDTFSNCWNILIDAILEQFMSNPAIEIVCTTIEKYRGGFLARGKRSQTFQIAEFSLNTKIRGKKLPIIMNFRKRRIERFAWLLTATTNHLIGTVNHEYLSARVTWIIDEANQMVRFALRIKSYNPYG